MIKQVVQKQMTKRPRKRVVEQYASDEDDNEDEDEDEYDEPAPPKPQHKQTESVVKQPPPQQFRSRIRR